MPGHCRQRGVAEERSAKPEVGVPSSLSPESRGGKRILSNDDAQHRVVIAVDPHKTSWTAAAVDESLQPLAAIRVPVNREGYQALHRLARTCKATMWAIEGATELGSTTLTARLANDGMTVVDVPAKLAARVRLLSTGHGRKNDHADAVSIGIAALTASRLNTATLDAAATALRAVVDHRDDLVKTRTQTINRLQVVLTNLVPGGAKTDLTAERAAAILRSIRPRDGAAKALRALAVDLTDEVRQLDRRIAKAAHDIENAVTASQTTLTQLHGIGTVTAAKISSAGSAISPAFGQRPPSRTTPAPPRSRCPPGMSSAIGYPAQATASSTHACT